MQVLRSKLDRNLAVSHLKEAMYGKVNDAWIGVEIERDWSAMDDSRPSARAAAAAKPSSLVGERVEIFGVSRAELNGVRGVARELIDATPQRYRV